MRIRHNKKSKEIIKKCGFLVDNPQKFKGKWHDQFKNNNPIHLEIGMGKGNFIIGMALKKPYLNFIGIERYDTIVAKAIEKINVLELDNIKLIKIDALELPNIFNKEIETIYLNFSDPWPKVRHEKRRLTSPNFLKIYDDIFLKDKIIIQKTDNIDLFNYSLESIKNYGYEIIDFSRDLHSVESDNTMTEYEEKFSKQGVKINYLKAKMKG